MAQKYPGATVSDTTGTDSPAAAGDATAGDGSGAVTYSVHWWYHHTDTFLFVTNTASLDYYYYTRSHKVVGDNRCTWHDSGATLVHINNIAINHWVSNSLGYCDADVQLSEWPDFINGYLDQDMTVSGVQAIGFYFHEHLP